VRARAAEVLCLRVTIRHTSLSETKKAKKKDRVIQQVSSIGSETMELHSTAAC
jgi:hypothetical protein